MLDRRLGEIVGRVARDDQGRIGLAPGEQVHRGELTRIEAGIAAAEVDAERESGLPGHDVVRAGHVAVAAHRLRHPVGELVEIGGERQQRARIEVPAPVHREPHPEQENPETAALHAGDQILQDREGHARPPLDRGIDLASLDQSTQRPQHLEIAARLHLDEDVGRRSAGSTPHVHEHDGAVFPPVGDEHALWGHRVAREEPGVRLRRVAAPEHDEVGPVLDLTEGGGALAHALESDPRRAMADGGRRVHRPPDHVGDRDRHPLSLARRVGQPVDQREARLGQDLRSRLDRFFGGRRAAADERERTLLDTVLPEPRLAKDAGVLGLRDALLIEIHREVHIVAHAPAERAGGVPDDLQVLAHHPTLLKARSRPGLARPRRPDSWKSACRSRLCHPPSVGSTAVRTS